MDEASRHAHSRAEIALFLKATPCERCSHGPRLPANAELLSGDAPFDSFPIRCAACGMTSDLPVRVSAGPDNVSHDVSVINPSAEPSRLLDVGQWIMLYSLLMEERSQIEDRIHKRHLALKAAQCLDEAIKFYDDDENDLPPPEAFFCDDSRERFRNAPAQFSRGRLLGLRARLPSYPAGDGYTQRGPGQSR